MSATEELNRTLVDYAASVALLGKAGRWEMIVPLAMGLTVHQLEKWANTPEIDPGRLRSLIDWICWSALRGLTCDLTDFSDRFRKV